jgi:hypothetical protein
MANTWRSVALAVTFASGKSMLDIFQDSGGSRVYRVRRAYQFNNGVTAVTGVLTQMRITRITTASGGAGVTPVAHDTNNSALASNLTSGTGRTVTTTAVFRQYLWSNDEPTVSAASMDEWELFVPFAEVWNAGYGDANVQPITCRAAQGFQIRHEGTTAVGSNDFEIEFTDEAS